MYSVAKLYEPKTLGEALDILSEKQEARLIAGGTDLLVKMRHGKWKDTLLLSLRNLECLKEIKEQSQGQIEIGSLVTFTQLARNEIITEKLNILKIASLSMGGPQIQNIATIGGNICNGATSADSAPALFALEAKLCLESKTGTRIIPIKEFYLGPSKVDLKRGEILTKIIIDLPPMTKVGGYYTKFSVRKAMDISMLGSAVICTSDDGKRMNSLRIALGTAAPTPVRCLEAEQHGLNKIVTTELLEEIGLLAVKAGSPRSSWRASKEYREQLIKELTVRTVQEAFLAAGGDLNA